MNGKILGVVLLVLAAFIWGTAFVAQSMGMRHLEPFTFNAVRFFIGGLALVPVIALRRSKNIETRPDSGLLKAGFWCGLLLCLILSFQQVGIVYTTVGKAGFITALYVVIVPLFGLLGGRGISWRLWGCISAATAGMYLLCINEDIALNKGDVYVFACAVASAGHILMVDKVAWRVDGVWLSFLQFLFCALFSAALAVMFETPKLGAVLNCWGPLFYTGVLSCGIAYTLQIFGQKITGPVLSALILSLESVFSALAGWFILGEKLSLKEMSGCVVIFAAILAAQLPALLASKPSLVKRRQKSMPPAAKG